MRIIYHIYIYIIYILYIILYIYICNSQHLGTSFHWFLSFLNPYRPALASPAQAIQAPGPASKAPHVPVPPPWPAQAARCCSAATSGGPARPARWRRRSRRSRRKGTAGASRRFRKDVCLYHGEGMGQVKLPLTLGVSIHSAAMTYGYLGCRGFDENSHVEKGVDGGEETQDDDWVCSEKGALHLKGGPGGVSIHLLAPRRSDCFFGASLNLPQPM